jgi:hypothetical protein
MRGDLTGRCQGPPAQLARGEDTLSGIRVFFGPLPCPFLRVLVSLSSHGRLCPLGRRPPATCRRPCHRSHITNNDHDSSEALTRSSHRTIRLPSQRSPPSRITVAIPQDAAACLSGSPKKKIIHDDRCVKGGDGAWRMGQRQGGTLTAARRDWPASSPRRSPK